MLERTLLSNTRIASSRSYKNQNELYHGAHNIAEIIMIDKEAEMAYLPGLIFSYIYFMYYYV
jgi:hypothetical protein